jgi:hypothetical protein
MSKTARLGLALGAGLTVIGLMATVGPLSAAASSDTHSTTANVAVNPVITLSGLTSSFTLTGNPGATAAANSAVTMNVRTNNITGYSVSVQAASANMAGATSGNTDVIPVSALSVRETGTTPFSALSNTAPVTVHTQATRSAAAGDTVNNDFSVAVPFVNSDTYSATLNYVAATQ